MKRVFDASAAATVVSLGLLFAAAGTDAAPVSFACSGAKADAARKAAKSNNLKLGMDPKACFGEMKLTGSDRRQIVVSVASPACKAGTLLDVYDRSRAGSWHSLFKQPVCGKSISVGPKSPYGDNMITIDGRHYIDKAGDFVPLK